MIEHLAHGVNSWGQQRGAARMGAIYNKIHGIQPAAQEIVYNKAATDKLIAELNQKISVNSAIIHGERAVADALRDALAAVAPNHPLLKPSGIKFQDGTPKSGLRKFFEIGFDKRMKEIGGVFGLNPKAYRKD